MRTILIALLVFSYVSGTKSFAKNGAIPLNKIGINLVQITNNHVGVGLFYEHIIEPTGRLSYTLPVSIGWDMQYATAGYISDPYKERPAIFINPGLKFYPAGNNRRIFNYAVGLSLFYHRGNSSGIYGNGFTNTASDNFLFSTGGILINNYVAYNTTEYLSFGFEFGIGPTYFNNYKEKNTSTTIKGGMNAMVNLAFQVAYKF